MPRLIGKIKLRNTYYLWDEQRSYYRLEPFKDNAWRPQDRYPQKVLKKDVVAAKQILSGRHVTVKDFMLIVTTHPSCFSLRNLGYKFQFKCQNLLVSLVCLGLAKVRKQGRRFIYQIV